MRLELVGNTSRGSLCRVSGLVHWEARDRPSEEVYVAVPAAQGRTLAEDGGWLLVGTLTAAQHHREPRLRVEAPVSPVLLGHLRSAQGVLQSWYGEDPVPIEARTLKSSRQPPDRATALFLSGGVDSTASLLTYQAQVPRGHPDALRYGVNVDLTGGEDPTDLRPVHRTVLDAIRPLSEMTDVELLGVTTNLRRLEDNDFDADWMHRAHGALFAAVAHALSPFVARMLIASSFWYPILAPWGSHPMLDPLFGSSDVTIDHHNAHLDRYAKVLRVVELGGTEAARCLVVCTGGQQRSADEPPNCGRCEKCLRTLTALTAAGVDTEQLTTFEERSVTPALIRGSDPIDPSVFYSWWRLIAPLRAAGRADLSRAAASKVRAGRFFAFDRRHLRGTIWRAKVFITDPSRALRSMRRRLTR